MKKNKKESVDLRLFVLRNVRKTFKYYFKNILYILFTNIVGLFIINNFLKYRYANLLTIFILNPMIFRIFYYGGFLIFFLSIKVILYGNTVYVMKINGVNDIKELFSLVIRRLLPTIGTFFVFIFAISFFTSLLILPGIFFFFYYYFGIFLCGVGDVNNKEKNTPKLLNSGKAMSRSFHLVKNNLLRFIIATIIISFITYTLQKFAFLLIFQSGFIPTNLILNIIKFSIYDIIIIYSALMFLKLQGIENDMTNAEFKNNKEENVMMSRGVINKFTKG